MGPILTLAVVLGAGTVPIPDSVIRFPNSSYWLGVGLKREANMLSDVLGDAGRAMRYEGPGPQQLAARWAAGQLNAAERVAVLLGGAAFHDPVLLPCYAEALQATALRERQAAAVGLAWLIGGQPPVPASLEDTPGAWRDLARVVSGLAAAARARTLVGMWVDSYLFSTGVRPWARVGGRRSSPVECLRAIRRIAQPADLPELIALWPYLVNDEHRHTIIHTLEMITVQRLVARMPAPSGATGQLLYDDAINRVNRFVQGVCAPPDGEEYLLGNLRRHGLLGPRSEVTVETWVAVLKFEYPAIWPIAAERLMELGAKPVTPNRQNINESLSLGALRRLLSSFPITADYND